MRSLILLVAGAISGCCFGPLGGGAGGGGGRAEPSGPPPDDASNDAVLELESHFTPGTPWGDGPDGLEMARTLHEGGEPGDAIVVRVIDGSPRRIVALLKYVDDEAEGLRDLPDRERREHLDAIREELDEMYDARDAHLAIGVRGTFFYGAILTRAPGEEPRIETGTILSSDPIEAILDLPASAPTPPPELVLGARAEGRAPLPPDAPARLALTITEPTDVAATLTVGGEEDQEQVWLTLCRGDVRSYACEGSGLELETTPIDDEPWEVYRLAPGRYTAILGAYAECEARACDPIPFALELRAVR